MIVFLTSSPSGPLDQPNDAHVLDAKNQFVEQLKKYWKKDMRGLMVSAYPDSYMANDELVQFFEDWFRNSGVSVSSFTLWDDRVKDLSLQDYDVVVLAGGHVPTQNAFFQKIHLREQMEMYQGIVIGISAGTMNSADVVYAQPELPNESVDVNYVRFIRGLGITSYNVLPHYQMVKYNLLDGKRLYEDITYSDSFGHTFYVLVDGSYILQENGYARVFGEAYALSDGHLRQICSDGESVVL